MNKTILTAALASFLSQSAFSQLYLIAGTADQNYTVSGYSTELVAVGANGSVRVARELVHGDADSGQHSARFVATSLDRRKAVVFSQTPADQVMVIDLDAAAVVKSCRHPNAQSLFLNWLVDSPSRGLLLVGAGDDEVTGAMRLFAMSLDPAVPCEQSFSRLDAGEMKYVATDGAGGIGAHSDFIVADRGPDGSMVMRWLNGEQTVLDYKVPLALLPGPEHVVLDVAISNRELLGVNATQVATQNGVQTNPPKVEAFRFLVFRRSDQTWQQLPERYPGQGRGFGHFVAWVEVRPKSDSQRESAGKAEWRPDDFALTGPATIGHFRIFEDVYKLVYPGVLHLYDIAAGKSYTINTRQGDSEILLVENAVVYYRAANRLYSAPILENGLGPEKLLATDELIRDAHWAFIKH